MSMLSQTVRELCAQAALCALCALLLPERQRGELSLITGLLCAGSILHLAVGWAG